MFKAVALSIALIVGVGPGLALLCRAWCDPHLAAAAGCHSLGHEDEIRVATANECDDQFLGGAPFLQEDVHRGVTPPAGHAVPGVAHDFIARSVEHLPPCRAESGQPSQAPPLSLNLRI